MVKVTTVRDLDSSKRTKPKIGEILFDETNGNIFLSVKVGKETKIINFSNFPHENDPKSLIKS